MASLLHLENLTHFYGQHCALRDVNLDMPAGAIGLVGQNGAGKSTLMQILLGMIRPTEGSATVLGTNVARAGTRLRGRIGYMPERDCLVPGLNGIEYVALAGELCGMPRRQALRRAHEMLTYLGMEEARYRRVEQYSVGMTQRLKLAATLVHDPDLLLLDEPTAGLDPEGRTGMLELLSALASREGKSMMLSTHLLGDIEHVCSAAIILHEGQVISSGELGDLRAVRRRCFVLRWEGEGDAWLTSLEGLGAEVRRSEGRVAKAIVANDFQTRVFFQSAQQHAVRIVGLEPEEDDLETVYLRLVAEPSLLDSANVEAAT